jgi:hypothetical protein
MPLCNRKSRRQHKRRTISLACGTMMLGAACHDSSLDTTAPTQWPPPASLVPTTSAGDQLSRRLSMTPGSCIIAVRAPDGAYHSHSVTIPLVGGTAPGASATRFAYRGWTAGVPEPVLLVVCTAPNSTAGLAALTARFGGRAMSGEELRSFAQQEGITDVERWGKAFAPMIMQGAPPTYVTDGLVLPSLADMAASRARLTRKSGSLDVSPMDVCDPNAIIPEPGCDPGDPEQETIPDTPPPDPVDPDLTIIDESTGATYTEMPTGILAPFCTVGTDYPHRSTTVAYAGNINVKSWNQCTAPMYQSVQTNLRREKCFLWVFCSWPVVAQSLTYTNPSALEVTAPAYASCAWQDGWYEGEGYHTTIYLGGPPINTHTQSPGVRLKCW